MPRAIMPHYETQYLELMARVWRDGDPRTIARGLARRSLFGEQLQFDLTDGRVPLLTTKRVYWKTAARELLWFLTGNTNIRPLLQQGVTIWSDWPLAKYRAATGEDITQEAFETRVCDDAHFAARWGDLGPVYGKQWVDWPVYTPVDGSDDLYRRGDGINQLAALVSSLRDNPGSRRHLFTGWNVAELGAMALPPCHMTYQFHVSSTGGLSCLLFQRSCDVALGLPFNLFAAALLTAMLAQQTGLTPARLTWSGGDVHLYQNHAALVEEQLSRTPSGDPRLQLARHPASLFDYAIDDFVVTDYAPQSAIRAPVAV
ncbi:MAG: thymidylate synthase [Sphingomonadales bacterium]|nr:thymidylate synthase [Sphingomonadales bacterium]